MRGRRPLRGLAALCVAVLLLAALLGVLPKGTARKTARPAGTGRVTYVYDGDTIEVAGVGKVRLIGIDAMDGYNADRTAGQSRRYGMSPERVRHWAEEATRSARRTLQGREVRLGYGPEAFDAYGRVLAYVMLGEEGRDFGLEMITAGLAAAYERFDHPRRGQYLRAQQRAQAQRTGMWSDAQIRP